MITIWRHSLKHGEGIKFKETRRIKICIANNVSYTE